MTDAEFEALVARLDRQAQQNPAAYRLKVMLLAFAGYGYIALVLVVAAGLFFGSLASLLYLNIAAVMLALVFGGFFWLVADAMRAHLEPPQGRPVNRYEAPELFDMIDKLRRSLSAPKFHEVLITDGLNAAVVQTPRLGLLGWYRNALLLGLPLMKALTREQFAAVLAHEFGHLAGGHGRLGHWIYRLRFGWMQLAAVLKARRSVGGFIFRPFFKWYVPYFSAVSFPLARADEYQADAASARLTSSSAAAAALTNVNVIGSFLNARFWPDLHRKADDNPVPSFTPYAQMGGAFAGDMDTAAVRSWLDAAMRRETSLADTHPALADRLRALREQPCLALPSADEAADTLLRRAALESITAAFDRSWRDQVQPSWDDRHQQVQYKRRQLSALDTRTAQGAALTLDERFQRAILTDEVGAGVEAAVKQFRALFGEAPGDTAISYALGARLLRIGDFAGVVLVELAIENDQQALLPGAAALRDYYAGRGESDKARQWHERWLQRMRVLQAAQAERASIHLNDKFEPHGLDDQLVAALRAQLSAIPGVRRAYVVRKHVTQLTEHPLFALGFTTRPWWCPRFLSHVDGSNVREKIAKDIQFPHEALIVCVEGDNRRFGRKWRRVRGSRVI